MNLKYRKIILKISGEVLGQGAETYNFKTIRYIIKQISTVHELGVKIGLVIGGGNILRGKTTREINRIDADFCGMVATIINGMMLRPLLAKNHVKTEIRSALAMPGVIKHANRSEDLKLYESGVVLIFVGGTGNPLFTTDTAAALRAAEMDSDILIKGTKVEGVYSTDPEKNRRARFFPKLKFKEAIDKNLMVMDSTAFNICQEADIPIFVYNLLKYPLSRVVKGDRVGTLVTTGG